MKKLALLWILIYAIQIFGQDKPLALKFDEYIESGAEEYTFRNNRLENVSSKFALELARNESYVGYIVFYNPRKGRYPLSAGGNIAESAFRSITDADYYQSSKPQIKIPKERVVLIDGGHRELTTVEFWIGRKDGWQPSPSGAAEKTEIAVCPYIYLAGSGFRKKRTEPLRFSVSTYGEPPGTNYLVEWTISAGEIIRGQSTKEIEVNISDIKDRVISASVNIKGLHPECNNYASISTEIGLFPFEIDEIGPATNGDIKQRMDSLRSFLNQNPDDSGYLIVYGRPDLKGKDVAKRKLQLTTIMMFLGVDPKRWKIIDGGFRDEISLEIFVLPAGVPPPMPTPTVAAPMIKPKKKSKPKK